MFHALYDMCKLRILLRQNRVSATQLLSVLALTTVGCSSSKQGIDLVKPAKVLTAAAIAGALPPMLAADWEGVAPEAMTGLPPDIFTTPTYVPPTGSTTRQSTSTVAPVPTTGQPTSSTPAPMPSCAFSVHGGGVLALLWRSIFGPPA